MKKIALLVVLVVFLAILAFGQPQEQEQTQVQPPPQGQTQETINYTNDSVARLSFLDGKAFLQRASDLGYEDAVLNMPITEGDRLNTADGRLEVYLGHANYLRLDQNTKVDFLNLPKRGYDRIRLRVWAGNVYLSVNGLEKEKDIELHTGDVSVYVLEKGLYRIDLKEGEGTEVLVFDGLVEAAGEDGSNMINNGQRAELAGGQFTTRPTRFVAVSDDSFGQWNDTRNALVQKTVGAQHLPPELSDYESELDENGTWADLAPYGSVWVPRGLGLGWHPYYYGRWVWLPLCGWTWMSYDPWGWAPYHYGRWGWDIGLGWYWIPTSIWGPAWVDYWWYGDYFGWAPLSWYGYPLVWYGNRSYDRWDRDYPHDSRVLTVIRKDQLSARDVSKVALGPDALKNVGKITLTSDRSLAPRPIDGGRLIKENMGGNQVMLKSTGRVAGDREIRRVTDNATTTKGTTATTGRKVIERSTTTKGTTVSKGTVSKSGSSSSSSAVRKIRKKDDSSFSPSEGGGSVAQNSVDRADRSIIGYPSRTNNAQGSYGIKSLRYSSPVDRFYNGFNSGSSLGSYSRSSGSVYRGSSSSGSYSRGSYSKSGSSSSSSRSSSSRSSSSRSSSSSRGSSSSSRGSSSSGHSSSSGSHSSGHRK